MAERKNEFIKGLFRGAGIAALLGFAVLFAYATDVFTVDKDGVRKFAVSDTGKITVGATESYVNLVIQNNSASPNNKVDITADLLIVGGIRLENVNVSADVAASGAGGLDSGSEAANTWYYVWVISNNDGTSSNGLLSISSTTPLLPSGYTKKRRVGSVRNNGSNNFSQFFQEGNTIIYDDPVTVGNVVTLGTSTSFTSISAAGYIPPTSRRGTFRGTLDIQLSSATTASFQVRKPGSTSVFGTPISTIRALNTTQQFREMGMAQCTTDSSQNIEYRIELGGGAISAGGATLTVYGYQDNI